MKRYIFLLLAFFLSFNAHAFSVASVSAAPNAAPSKASQRTLQELGSLQEPNVSSAKNEKDEKKIKTASLNSVSCKTYEGKTYEQGEAGYSDCIRTIKNDRQGTKSVP